MPYHVGEKGSYGCNGYPAVKDDGTVMGCHKTAEAAANQIYAINQSEGNIKQTGRKNMGSAMGQPEPASYAQSHFNWSTPVRKPERSSFQIGKAAMPELQEGMYVLGAYGEDEETFVGQVMHIMREGMLGVPGSELTIEAMPESPAILVRLFEQDEEGYWEETEMFVGVHAHMVRQVNILTEMDYYREILSDNPNAEQGDEMMMMAKAESYSPNDGMKAAARRAIKWKEDGKAKGAGTAVGWGRARDIVAGRSMSLSVVKRMYSFFSRHEVDKKGKGFYDGPDFPSKGRVMWDAWGGDAGFSWSRSIVERESKKSDSIFSFGSVADLKDAKAARTQAWFEMRSEQAEVDLLGKADSVRVGQTVSWNSSGGTASGKVKRVIRSGSYDVPGTDVTINATEDNPAVVIELESGQLVAHRMSSLRAS